MRRRSAPSTPCSASGPGCTPSGRTEPVDLRCARIDVADLTGARLVDCDLTGVKVVDSWLVGVDVTDFVEGELERRHPERVRLRGIGHADGFRAMWDTVERLWTADVERARQLPEPALHERVNGEWSFVETPRHLVFITDSWASRTVLDEPMPHDRLGLPQTAYAPEDAAALAIELDARPSFADVLAVRAERMATVRRIVEGLADADLGRPCPRSPAPGYPAEERHVGDCLGVVMEEECEHHRFAVRDLPRLEVADPPLR